MEQSELFTHGRNAEAYLAALLESLDAAIIGLSLEFQILTWNKAAAQLFGYTSEEAVGRLPTALFAREWTGASAAFFRDLENFRGADRSVRHFEHTLLRKDGTTMEAALIVAGIYDTAGNLSGVSLAVRDISEQRLRDQELARLAAIVESSDDAIISISTDARVTGWNHGAEKLFGVTAQQAIGHPEEATLSAELREEAIRTTKEDLAAIRERPDFVHSIEISVPQHNGNVADVRMTVSGIFDRTGQFIGLSKICRNITEYRRAEREQARLAAIVECSDDAIISFGTDLLITSWNHGAEKMLGFTPAEALGKTILDLHVPPGMREQVQGWMAEDLEVLRSNPQFVRRLEVPALRKDGSQIEASLVVSGVRDHSGQLIGVSNIMRDITESNRTGRERATLAAIVNASEDAIIGFSKDLIITYWNPGAQRIYGYPAQQAIGRGLDVFIPPEQQAQAAEARRHLFITGEPVSWEERARRGDGRWFTSSVSIFPIRDADGNIISGAGIGRDITHLKEIERQLREAHEYTRDLIESSIDAIVVVDGKMLITDCNEQLARLTTIPKKELIASPFDSYFADRLAAENAIRKTFADGYVTNIDLLLEAASGKKVPVSFNASLFYRAGQVLGIVGVARDVTEQRVIERTLREQREYGRGLIQSAPDALLVCNSELILTDANDQASALTGYSRDELLGISLPSLFSEPIRTNEQITSAWQQGGIRDVELELLTQSAGHVAVSLNISAFSSSDSGNRHIIVSLRDMSERKRAEQERSLLAAIVDSSGDAIYSESPDLAITSWNPAAEKLYGYSSADIIGRNAALLVPLERRAELVENARKVQATGKAHIFESKRVRRDGTVIDVTIAQSPVRNAAGVVTGISVMAHDISDRKRLEGELARASDAALESTRMKSAFLANMSHEIRTPLNSIIGLTGLLLDTSLSSEQHELVRDVRASGDALLSLINDILDFSKMAAGKLLLEEFDFDLATAVEETVELMAEQARQKGLELTCVIDPEVPRLLRGDPGRLRQILLNLLSNAVKFTKHGEVDVAVTKLSENPHEALLHFEVRDTGPGIAAEQQHLLFEPFTQLDTSAARHYGGTGLGLSISRTLVEAMHGTISVSSRVGEGSTFWFTITLAKQLNTSRPAADRFVPLTALKVLIVDDDPASRRILESQLSSWGVQARSVESAEEGLAVLRAAASGESYQLALLDVMMPGLDGIEMARLIKSDPVLAKTVVIFDSSMGTRLDFSARLTGLEVAAWLMKPVPESTLYNALTAVLNSSAKGAAVSEPLDRQTNQASRRFKLPPHLDPRVLLAEDNPINQKVAQLQLRKLGLEVDAVSNGYEALAAAARRRYDLIFMDCQMPELDGYEATRELRRREPAGTHSSVIAMTARALPGDREKCLAAGMDAYISKPVTQEALEAALCELFPSDSSRPDSGPAASVPALPITPPSAPVCAPSMPPPPQSETFAAEGPASANDSAANSEGTCGEAAHRLDGICDQAALKQLRTEDSVTLPKTPSETISSMSRDKSRPPIPK